MSDVFGERVPFDRIQKQLARDLAARAKSMMPEQLIELADETVLVGSPAEKRRALPHRRDVVRIVDVNGVERHDHWRAHAWTLPRTAPHVLSVASATPKS